MADTGGSVAKVCAACAKDVSALPRTKDGKGRYFCRPCFAKLTEKAAKPKAAEPDPVLAMILEQKPKIVSCPDCDTKVESGTKLCVMCGYNFETGASTRVKVEIPPQYRSSPERGEGGGGRTLMAVINALADSPVGLLFALGGAFLGGLAGAGAYSWVMVSSGYEIFPIAVVVGFLTGLGALIPLRGFAGTAHGVIAAVVALAAIVGGRYIAIETFTDQLVAKETRHIKIGDEDITALIGRDVAREWAAQGTHYQWPEGSDPVTARSEKEFPAPVWQEAQTRFAAMDEAKKAEKRAEADAELRQAIKDAKTEAAGEAFTQTLNQRSGYRYRTGWSGYIKWMIIGVVVAFCVGSGGRNPFQD